MEVTSCPWSDIEVSPARIDFEVMEGSQFIPVHQYLHLKKSSPDRSPNWSAAANEAWVRITPTSGDVPKMVSVGARSVGMAVGVYHAQITITSHVNVTPPVVDITLTVKSKEQPPPPEPPEPPEPPPEEPEEPEPPSDEGNGDEEPEPPPDEKEKCWLCRIIEWLLGLIRKEGSQP